METKKPKHFLFYSEHDVKLFRVLNGHYGKKKNQNSHILGRWEKGQAGREQKKTFWDDDNILI